MSYFVQLAYKKDLFAFLSERNWYCNLTDKIKCCFYQKNTIHIIGKKCMMTNSYIGNPKLSLVCSDTYRAVWQNIISNIHSNKSIYEITEFFNTNTDDNQTNKSGGGGGGGGGGSSGSDGGGGGTSDTKFP